MIEELAKYFTGPSVTFHSISLNMDGKHRAAAKAFFETRAALGIGGYDTFEDAVTTIKSRVSSARKEEV